MAGEPALDKVLADFRHFSGATADLPLYCRLAAAIADDREVAALLLAARPGQARPVLLLAAVHDLVLRRPHLPLARWYPSVTPAADLADGDPYPAFRATCLDHADELRSVIATRSTQTNEVNRVALLAPLLAEACADVPSRPVALVELGASAGLLLGLERYRIEVGDVVLGDPSSAVRVAAEVRGRVLPTTSPFPPAPPVLDRVGIDLSPVELTDVDRVRWLEACLWPDQPERVERFRAAVGLLRHDPPRLVTGDLVERLPDVLAGLPDAHVVVFHGWALTYVERSRRPRVGDLLARFAAERREVSWLSAEPPRCVPGVPEVVAPTGSEEATPDTVLGLRRWRDGRELDAVAVGFSHPHGAWLTWDGR